VLVLQTKHVQHRRSPHLLEFRQVGDFFGPCRNQQTCKLLTKSKYFRTIFTLVRDRPLADYFCAPRIFFIRAQL
jgi:hypothetical protein